MDLDWIISKLQAGVAAAGFTDSLKFDCGDAGTIVLADGAVTREDRDTDCTIRISAENLEKLIKGKLNPMLAVGMGKLKLSGDPTIAMKLGKLLG